MENKRETKKELELDQLEQVTGGDGASEEGYDCSESGKEFEEHKEDGRTSFFNSKIIMPARRKR